MQEPQLYPERLPDAPSPTESLGWHLPWLIGLALVGIGVLTALLGFSTYSIATVLAPDRGGTFREGVAGMPQYLSPIWCQDDDVDRDLCALVYRGLTRVDKRGRVVPDLAEAWQITDDRTYVFRLKPNQFWHDGRAVTAADVMFTVGVLQDPTLLDTPGLPSFWRNVQVEQLDEMTVRFTLPQPFAPFLDYTTIGLLPKHVHEGVPARELVTRPLTATPIGSGPMRVVEITPDHLRLEPSAFAGGSAPYISVLEFQFLPVYNSVLAAFDQGTIDGIRRILPANIETAAARKDLQLFSSVESGYVNVLLNLDNPNTPFFQEKGVRQALLLAVDREAIIQDILAGQGVTAPTLLTPENWAYNPEVTTYPYDPVRAGALLDAAGWVDSDGDGVREKDGVTMELGLITNAGNTTREDLGVYVQDQLKQIGIAVDFQAIDFGTMLEQMDAQTHDMYILGWTGLGADPNDEAFWS